MFAPESFAWKRNLYSNLGSIGRPAECGARTTALEWVANSAGTT